MTLGAVEKARLSARETGAPRRELSMTLQGTLFVRGPIVP